MAKIKNTQPPPRKEPGLIGNLFSALVQLLSWLFVSLLISIAIEWIGMTTVWTEEGAYHSQGVLMADQVYLNQQIVNHSSAWSEGLVVLTLDTVNWIKNDSWLQAISQWAATSSPENPTIFHQWANDLYRRYHQYFQASLTVSQVFIVRLALIVFSSPAFVLFAVVGAMDGLVERDLRRWGGGRESSNVYNLARKSVAPAFIAACVIYISVPFSVNPVVVIMPFALLMGLGVRIAFERLKKYF